MNVNLPSEFPSRLREERRRLGMNQTEFAKATGVHLNSQSRYEKGERAPDTTYLAALAKVGVDLVFVLTGERGKDRMIEHRAIVHVLNVIQGFLGFWKPPLSREFEQTMQDAYEAQKEAWTTPTAAEHADGRLREMLLKSPEVLPTPKELEHLLFCLDVIPRRAGFTLSASEKADALRRIYQEEKRAGQPLSAEEVEKIIRACIVL